MSDLLDSLIARAEGWAAQDPDPFTKAELEALISARDEAELADRFDGTLEFGTAGSARRAGRGLQPDEPRRRHPGGCRPGGVPQGHRCPGRRVRS